MYKLLLISFFCLSGCAASTYNLLDITEDQWIQNAQGERCIEKEMIITPETFTYYYGNCDIIKVVKPKIRPTPKPQHKECTDRVCYP